MLHLLKDLKNDNWILVIWNPSDNLTRDNTAWKFHEGTNWKHVHGGLVCASTTWTQHLGDSCATGEPWSNAGIFKIPRQREKFQTLSWELWSARMLDVPCEWSTSWPHFNHKQMSGQLIIPQVSGGEPTVQNVLYLISLQTSAHPSVFFSCSTAGKQWHLANYCFLGGLVQLNWSH